MRPFPYFPRITSLAVRSISETGIDSDLTTDSVLLASVDDLEEDDFYYFDDK